MTQWNAADALGISPRRVRVLTRYLGGGFGSKGSAWAHTWIVAQVARQLERPVRLVLSRDQMSMSIGYREEQVHQVTLAAGADGRLAAIRQIKTSATSPFDDFAEPSCNTGATMYASPNAETRYRLAQVNAMTPCFMRGVGHATGTFAIESALDELAYELAIDPLELRIRNHADVDPRTGTPWSSKSLIECYQVAADRIGWHDRDPRPGHNHDNDLLVGWGVSSAMYPVNPRELTEMRVRLFSDGTALVQCGAQDIGTGTYTVLNQVAADALGLDPSAVTVAIGDTDYPRVGNSTGATTAAAVSSAVMIAATQLREQVVRWAVADPKSPLHRRDANAVTAANGVLQAHNRSAEEPYGAVLMRHQTTTVDSFGSWDPASGVATSGGKISTVMHGNTSAWSFGAWFAKVTVDPDLGLIRVTRMSGAWGVGRVLNEKTAASQMRGGAVMGIGQALLEASAIDTSARLANPGLNEYLIATHADVPEIDTHFVEEHDENINPLGAKGLGELGVVGAAAAIANAVFHATGRRIRHLPILPEDLQ